MCWCNVKTYKMKGMIILKFFKSKESQNDKSFEESIFSTTEKIELYSMVNDLSYIVKLLVKVSEQKIEPSSVQRIYNVLDKMRNWLKTQIKNKKECLDIMNMNEDELWEYCNDEFDLFL